MKTKKHFLFCPGPVNISQNVKDAVQNEIGHREIEFSKLILSINNKLLKLYEIKNPRAYQPVLITGSGTAANESVLSSVVNGKNILIVSNGEFGERLYEISKIYNPNNTFHLRFDWAKHIDLDKVSKFIEENNIKALAMVHHETSTGMLNPVQKMGKLAKKHGLTFILDSVSSVGAEKIDLEKWNVTYCIGTSGKAIGSLPGVAFVIAKKKDFEILKDYPPKTMYLNLYNFYYYSSVKIQTPNTPAVQLFFALEQALSNIHFEGVKHRRNHIKAMTGILRSGMKNLGLRFEISEEDMSCVLTTVKIPSYIDFETLKARLKDKNIIIYNGKGSLLNKVFQVGNIGAIDVDNVEFFLDILSMTLKNAKTIKRSSKKQIPQAISNQTPTINQLQGSF